MEKYNYLNLKEKRESLPRGESNWIIVYISSNIYEIKNIYFKCYQTCHNSIGGFCRYMRKCYPTKYFLYQ